MEESLVLTTAISDGKTLPSWKYSPGGHHYRLVCIVSVDLALQRADTPL